VNTLVLVLYIGVWSSNEMIRCHVLNTFHPHDLWNVRMSEMYGCLKSFQTATFFQPKSSLYFVYFLAFFCASYQKLRNLYGTNELSVSKWIIKLNKRIKKIIFISILPSCSVILPNPPCNRVANSIPFKNFLAIKIYTRKFSLII